MSTGRPLPKFGEWDVNNPASADGFTVIFSKARNEKKAPVNGHTTTTTTRSSDIKDTRTDKINSYRRTNSASKKWFCCVSPSPTQP
ncbi:hypothetical protein GUJ93_ZPchr0002g26545 [Zizania palustris]|uniref:RIN4 pathogenic type III effector avirulence factor Avr cleavage site domain-containing protein n=1 Tax=Zizania palustris TaxID=103762 RepID=A0A8J5SAK2_ZIZPA|nr:hypothetical protein GUJ93_ZPchr0002g26545 [Zizania palustris]